jgi:glycosyltransferase involved in cell wall biosynthesis
MKIVLATGIYPPDIGGPATYVQNLARELSKKSMEVTVITYRKAVSGERLADSKWKIIYVSKRVPIVRWFLYAWALRTHGRSADIIYCFSSISCGVPLVLSRIKKPKKILRLGGDFFWERYSALGGLMSLKEWYHSLDWTLKRSHTFMHWLLKQFDVLVFSTEFQREIYKDFYQELPENHVIENAIPEGVITAHKKHEPFRLLFMGRFVGFKNLPVLLEAVEQLPSIEATFVGDGPVRGVLESYVLEHGLDHVRFKQAVSGKEKEELFKEQDLLIIPSTTEISPNVALEARSQGLPVLLSQEHGLSPILSEGMTIKPLRKKDEIVSAILDVIKNYESISKSSAKSPIKRSWNEVFKEHTSLFTTLS